MQKAKQLKLPLFCPNCSMIIHGNGSPIPTYQYNKDYKCINPGCCAVWKYTEEKYGEKYIMRLGELE